MSIFKRIVNIIKSNINYKESDVRDNIDINSYEDFYYEDTEPIHSSNSQEEDYYKILELDRGADFKQIRQSYRKLLKKYHPDLFQGDKEKQAKAIKVTKKINEAYTYFERRLQ